MFCSGFFVIHTDVHVHVNMCSHAHIQIHSQVKWALQSPYRHKHTKIHLSALGDISGREKKILHKNVTKVFLTELISGAQR